MIVTWEGLALVDSPHSVADLQSNNTLQSLTTKRADFAMLLVWRQAKAGAIDLQTWRVLWVNSHEKIEKNKGHSDCDPLGLTRRNIISAAASYLTVDVETRSCDRMRR
jgi:hypothetical protein